MPAYTFPANREDLAVLRIVCRNGFSHDLADLLLDDLRAVVDELQASAAQGNQPHRPVRVPALTGRCGAADQRSGRLGA